MGINNGFMTVLITEGIENAPYTGIQRCKFTEKQFCSTREEWNNALEHVGMDRHAYWEHRITVDMGSARVGNAVTMFKGDWVYLYIMNSSDELVSEAFTTLNVTGIDGTCCEECEYGSIEYYPVARFNWTIYNESIYKRIMNGIDEMNPEEIRAKLPRHIPIIYGVDVPWRIKESLAKKNIHLINECGYIFCKDGHGGLRVKRMTMHPRTALNLERFSKKYGSQAILAEIEND